MNATQRAQRAKKYEEEHDAMMAQMQAERYLRIANSAVLTDEEARAISMNEYNTVAQKEAKIAYDLAAHYGVHRSKITADFVAKYKSRKVRQVFTNLNLACSLVFVEGKPATTITDAMSAWRASIDTTDDRYLLGDLDEDHFAKCMIAIKALDCIWPGTSSSQHFESVSISWIDLIEGINKARYEMRRMADLVFIAFNVDRKIITSKITTNNTLVNFINEIIGQTFGLKIMGDDNYKIHRQYRLIMGAPFRWDQDLRRWVVSGAM